MENEGQIAISGGYDAQVQLVAHGPAALGPQVGIVDGSWITGRSLTWRVTAGKVHEASGTRAHATGPFGLQRISEL